MDLLNKFFPYPSLLTIDNNTLTAWWVLITLLYCFISILIFYVGILKITNSLKKIIASISIEDIINNPLLQDGWKKYTQTFLSSESGINVPYKTFEDASTFFNGQSILSKCLNLRYWQSLPGTIVGFGILGTFVGLTFGISSFDIESTESIKHSIETLLSGMSTAFVSSVWGMGLSIIFGFYEKHEFNKAYTLIDRFCYALDDQFKITKAEELKIAREQEERFLRSLFVYQAEDGQDILPSYVMRDMRREAEQQTKALKSFSTDLADGIRISSETIGILGNHVAYAMQQALKADFAPALGKIESAVQELREAKEESSGLVIERVMSDLKHHLEKMGQDFHSSLSGSVTAHMEDLANIVGHAGESLGLFPGQLQSMMEALDTRMNETKTLLDSSGQSVHQAMDQCLKEINTFFASMMKQLQNTVSSQQSVIQEACEKSNENMELTARKIREETGNSLESFRESVTVVQNNMLSILEQQNLGHLSLQNELQSAFNGMMGKLENSVSAQQNVIQEVCERTNESTELAIKRIRDETENAAERFAVIIKSLQDNMTSLLERQSDNTLSVQNLVSSTKDVFEKGSTLASEMSNASKLITDTLNKIKDLSGQLTANSETLNLTSDTLKNITQAFGIQSTKLTGIYNEILNQFDLALKEAQKTASEYSMMFPTIRQDLENIVDQLVDGMHKYQETARESLNKTLAEFAEHLSEAVTSLHGGIEELADIVEEITESKTKLTSVFTR